MTFIFDKKDVVRIVNPTDGGKAKTSGKQANKFLRNGRAILVGDGEIRFVRKCKPPREQESPYYLKMAPGGKQVGDRKSSGLKRRLPQPARTPEELHWRESVLIRDGYACVWCGATERLEADHIKPKVVFPDLKYDVDNGRTLCNPCHRTTDTYGRKAWNAVKAY